MKTVTEYKGFKITKNTRNVNQYRVEYTGKEFRLLKDAQKYIDLNHDSWSTEQ